MNKKTSVKDPGCLGADPAVSREERNEKKRKKALISGRLFAAEYLRNICRLVCGGIVDFFENSIIIKLCVFKGRAGQQSDFRPVPAEESAVTVGDTK